ncbi:MAG: hypothetical protein ABSA02_10425 [Trebonia sp.]
MRKSPYVVAAFAIAGTALATSGAAAAQTTAKKPVSSGKFQRVTYVKNAVSPGVAFPSAVASGDVMGNGRNDLVVTTVDTDNVTGGTTIAVYPQLAHGKLGTPLTIKVRDTDDWTTRATIADPYDNGRNDLVVVHSAWDNVGVLAAAAQRDPRPGGAVSGIHPRLRPPGRG